MEEGEPVEPAANYNHYILQQSTVLTGNPAPVGCLSVQHAQRQPPHPRGSAAPKSRPRTAAACSAIDKGAPPSTASKPRARRLHVPEVPGTAEPELMSCAASERRQPVSWSVHRQSRARWYSHVRGHFSQQRRCRGFCDGPQPHCWLRAVQPPRCRWRRRAATPLTAPRHRRGRRLLCRRLRLATCR